MTKSILVFIAGIVLFWSCSNKKERPLTAIDTGRNFIRASLNGDFPSAQDLLLKDSQNIQLFEYYKQSYNKFTPETKEHYRTAEYKINKYLDINDSTTIINYSNDYMNKPMDIKVVRQDKDWRVDFKYTVSGNLPID